MIVIYIYIYIYIYNVISYTQVVTYSINDLRNILHNNNDIININPTILCKYVNYNTYDIKYNQHCSNTYKRS